MTATGLEATGVGRRKLGSLPEASDLGVDAYMPEASSTVLPAHLEAQLPVAIAALATALRAG